MTSDNYYDNEFDDDASSKDDIERTEDGRPMLSFPSMEKGSPKKSNVESTYLGGDSVANKKEQIISDAIGDSGEFEFYYNPDETQEKINREYCMKELESAWGSSTQDHLEVVKHLVSSYLDEDIALDVNRSGLGSHPILLQRIYETGKKLEAEAVELYGQPSVKGMSAILMKKMGERCREALNKAVYDAQAEIIALHGAIPSW